MSQSDFEGEMNHSKTEFDGYLMVDWSAANEPKDKEDSIWYCYYDRMDGAWTEKNNPKNPRTRREAIDGITSILYETTKHNRTVLVGFDFPFGYPAGFSLALGWHGEFPWRALWNELKEAITDDHKNRNNRFEVAASFNLRISGQPFPFWGCPETVTSPWISKKKARPHLAEFRVTDQRAKGAQPVWKLFGAGVAGGQALVGIPWLARLRDDATLGPRSAVWPFETGLIQLPPRTERKWLILYAEIFPAMFKAAVGPGEIKDEAQVRDLVQRLKAEDERGGLGEWFAGPSELSENDRRKIVGQEGWILGVM
jgi:hypothetical protein